MKTPSAFRQALKNMATNKVRTLLVMLGPAVGIALLTTAMALGEGTNQELAGRMGNFGVHAMNLISGGATPPPDLSVTTLTLEDVRAVEREVRGIDYASPSLILRRQHLEVEGRHTTSSVFGVDESWSEAWNWPAATGESITTEDLDTMARVCVLGQTVKNELFGEEENPVGRTIRLGKAQFTVKGVLTSRGTSAGGGDMDNRVIVPLTTAMRRLANAHHVNMVRLVVDNPLKMEEVAEQVRLLMRKRHRIQPPNPDDFGVITPKYIQEMVARVDTTMTYLLTIIAIVALLGGGIVVMNIMLVSVSERRGEIGLRRAVGATKGDVLLLFMVESAVATLTGGLVGVVLGLASITIVDRFSSMPVAYSPPIMGAALILAGLVGLVFGTIPARKAAALQPVDALRNG